jgi:hypothetical protein
VNGFRGVRNRLGAQRDSQSQPSSTERVKDFPVVVQDEGGLGVAKFGRPAGSAVFNYLGEGPFGFSHKPTYINQNVSAARCKTIYSPFLVFLVWENDGPAIQTDRSKLLWLFMFSWPYQLLLLLLLLLLLKLNDMDRFVQFF